MTIFESITANHKLYIQHCLDSLKADLNIFDIDCSKGETDLTRVLFLEKKGNTKYEAIAILSMRLLMYEHEWADMPAYTKEDIIRREKMLEKAYENSMYFPDVSHDEFINDHFVYRLQFAEYLKEIKLNNKVVDFEKLNAVFPKKQEILKLSKTNFQHLEQEYYIETETHFVLFNWYTTA
jgi:mannitol/fructose-specific phosphotransferase system IIA component (Ntr-type)